MARGVSGLVAMLRQPPVGNKEPRMTTTTILIVSAIASAFLLFAAVLAWADFCSGSGRPQAAAPKPADASAPATIDYRNAA
jgi:hypothetical protein